jgi:hypothetical protein
MRTFSTTLLFLTLTSISFGQSVWTSHGGQGTVNYNNASTWSCSGTCATAAPQATILTGDQVIISMGDIVKLAADLKIYGDITINLGAQLGDNDNEKISILADNGNYPQPFPNGVFGSMHNEGIVSIDDKFHNDGNSFNSGVLFCDEYHNDGYQCNSGDITAPSKFENHGGRIECCGNIYTDQLKLKKQTSNKGYTFYTGTGGLGAGGESTEPSWGESVVLCQNICNVANTNDPAVISIGGDNSNSGGDVLQNNNVQESYTASNPADPDLVTFCDFGLLPVTLVDFNIETSEGQTLLNWTTVSEINNDFFTVLRSFDGEQWAEIGIVDGFGNTTETKLYSFIDRPNHFGIIYYRLKQTDFNGLTELFDIRSVEFQNEETLIYPNPAHNTINIVTKNPLNELIVISTLGQLVTNKTQSTKHNNKWIELDITNLDAGMYIIKINNKIVNFVKQ